MSVTIFWRFYGLGHYWVDCILLKQSTIYPSVHFQMCLSLRFCKSPENIPACNEFYIKTCKLWPECAHPVQPVWATCSVPCSTVTVATPLRSPLAGSVWAEQLRRSAHVAAWKRAGTCSLHLSQAFALTVSLACSPIPSLSNMYKQIHVKDKNNVSVWRTVVKENDKKCLLVCNNKWRNTKYIQPQIWGYCALTILQFELLFHVLVTQRWKLASAYFVFTPT